MKFNKTVLIYFRTSLVPNFLKHIATLMYMYKTMSAFPDLLHCCIPFASKIGTGIDGGGGGGGRHAISMSSVKFAIIVHTLGMIKLDRLPSKAKKSRYLL